MESKYKISFLGGLIGLTLAIHYGLVLDYIFGHTAWVHAIHGRFCYIPIALAGVWFGLRGSLAAAGLITAAVLPYIFLSLGHGSLSGEIVEIVFYFAIAVLIGAFTDREFKIRRKHKEAELQLERSHKLSMVGQLAAGVAHEIKNPMASIKGAVEILVDPSTPTNDRDEFKQIVTREIKRVDGTIGEFLDFARPKDLRFGKVDMRSLVNAAVRQLEPQFESRGIEIQEKTENNIWVNGDYEKIHQVVLNLLLNAADASHRDGNIEVLLTEADLDMAILSVRDHGQGIDEEHLEKIFEPFYTTKSSGSGLGLAVVKSIVERHSGTIEISSRPEQGTEIKITLPIYRERK